MRPRGGKYGAMKQRTFEQSLARGREAEVAVAEWLRRRGWGIVPGYDYTGSDGNKGPRATFLSRKLIIPDLDIFKSGKRVWIEVKYYTYAPWNRKLDTNVHGIPRYYYEHYLEVEKESGHPVFLAVVEEKNSRLLLGRMSQLTPYPCQCKSCCSGSPLHCTAALRDGVYFAVGEFHQFVGAFGQWKDTRHRSLGSLAPQRNAL